MINCNPSEWGQHSNYLNTPPSTPHTHQHTDMEVPTEPKGTHVQKKIIERQEKKKKDKL